MELLEINAELSVDQVNYFDGTLQPSSYCVKMLPCPMKVEEMVNLYSYTVY